MWAALVHEPHAEIKEYRTIHYVLAGARFYTSTPLTDDRAHPRDVDPETGLLRLEDLEAYLAENRVEPARAARKPPHLPKLEHIKL